MPLFVLSHWSALALNTALNAVHTLYPNATIKMYTGPVPATLSTALTTQVLLVSTTFTGAPGVSANGTAVFPQGAIQPTTVLASGEVAFYRVATAGGAAIEQGLVGLDTLNVNVRRLQLVAGEPFNLGTWTHYMSEGGF